MSNVSLESDSERNHVRIRLRCDSSGTAPAATALRRADERRSTASNQLHDSAATQVSNLLQGGGGDLNDVMIAVEKADVSFQLMMQVRNKIVNAYQDIEKMQF